MESILKDIRYGVRGLLKHPGFTAIVVITLALGIGASTAIFSVVDNVLLRLLPYRNAERIVAIEELNREGTRGQVTSANFLDWRAQNTVFEQLTAIKTTTINLALSDHAERIDLAQTNANFFDVFGVTPHYGRLFIPQDEQAGHEPVVVVSDALWVRRFGSEASHPERIADDDDRFVSGLFILRNEQAPVVRRDSKHVEEVCVRLREIDPFRVIRKSEVNG